VVTAISQLRSRIPDIEGRDTFKGAFHSADGADVDLTGKQVVIGTSASPFGSSLKLRRR
jgi:cation diffusion facilitator CzcD-associated flavoprotein CzcO